MGNRKLIMNRREFIKKTYQIGGLAALYSLGLSHSDILAQGIGLMGGGGGFQETGDTYSDITMFWTCETASFGSSDYPTSGVTATFGSLSDLTADAAIIGSYGLDCPTTFDAATITVTNEDLVNGTESRIGFYYYINTWADANMLFRVEEAGDTYVQGELTGGDEILMRWRAGTNLTYSSSAANLSSSQTYYIEYAWNQTAPYRKIYVDGVEVMSNTDAFTAITPIKILLGNYSSASSDTYQDNIIISNDGTRDLNAIKALESSPK
jgi:hypothetical protein